MIPKEKAVVHELKECGILFVCLATSCSVMYLLENFIPLVSILWMILFFFFIVFSILRDLEKVYSFDAQSPSFSIHSLRFGVNAGIAFIIIQLVSWMCSVSGYVKITQDHDGFHYTFNCACDSLITSTLVLILFQSFVILVIRCNVTVIETFVSICMKISDVFID